jgi:hypothetical protein
MEITLDGCDYTKGTASTSFVLSMVEFSMEVAVSSLSVKDCRYSAAFVSLLIMILHVPTFLRYMNPFKSLSHTVTIIPPSPAVRKSVDMLSIGPETGLRMDVLSTPSPQFIGIQKTGIPDNNYQKHRIQTSTQ